MAKPSNLEIFGSIFRKKFT